MRPLSRAKIVFLLTAGIWVGVAALLAFAGVGPFPQHNADELAGVACGMLFMLAVWVGAQWVRRG
jgi:hypothetical protein